MRLIKKLKGLILCCCMWGAFATPCTAAERPPVIQDSINLYHLTSKGEEYFIEKQRKEAMDAGCSREEAVTKYPHSLLYIVTQRQAAVVGGMSIKEANLKFPFEGIDFTLEALEKECHFLLYTIQERRRLMVLHSGCTEEEAENILPSQPFTCESMNNEKELSGFVRSAIVIVLKYAKWKLPTIYSLNQSKAKPAEIVKLYYALQAFSERSTQWIDYTANKK